MRLVSLLKLVMLVSAISPVSLDRDVRAVEGSDSWTPCTRKSRSGSQSHPGRSILLSKLLVRSSLLMLPKRVGFFLFPSTPLSHVWCSSLGEEVSWPKDLLTSDRSFHSPS